MFASSKESKVILGPVVKAGLEALKVHHIYCMYVLYATESFLKIPVVLYNVNMCNDIHTVLYDAGSW